MLQLQHTLIAQFWNMQTLDYNKINLKITTARCLHIAGALPRGGRPEQLS